MQIIHAYSYKIPNGFQNLHAKHSYRGAMRGFTLLMRLDPIKMRGFLHRALIQFLNEVNDLMQSRNT